MTATQISFADFAAAAAAAREQDKTQSAAPAIAPEANEPTWIELTADVVEIQNNHDDHTTSASFLNYRGFLATPKEWCGFSNSERVMHTERMIELAIEIIGNGCEPENRPRCEFAT